MAKPKTMAKCHPERLHLAKGLCSACYRTKRSRKLWAENPQKVLQYQRDTYPKNREKRINSAGASRAKYMYGVPLSEYPKIQKACREKVCEICKQKPNGTAANSILHMDHQHGQKRLRGLICHHCNIGLGSFYDDPHLLQAAADYLALDLVKRAYA